MIDMKQAVILCGGKGTRLGKDFLHLPKPLVPVEGVALLDRIISECVRAGLSEVVLAAGHLGEQIEAKYAAGNQWNIRIRVHREKEPLGTAGCLVELADELDDSFALLYGDVFLDFDLGALLRHHELEKPGATILVRESDHPRDSDLVVVESGTDCVRGFLPKATRNVEGSYENCANAAVYAFSRSMLSYVARGRPSDIATHVFPAALEGGLKIRAHFLEETGYVKDMGTPARLEQVGLYLRRRARVREKRVLAVRAVILDRDGVVLKDRGPSTCAEEIEFLPGVLDGMRVLREAGLLCLMATNQPWIARGLLTSEQLEATHDRMRAVIAENGGRLGDIAVSPFHPETHHNEGIVELRRASECRKPRPGMLFDLMEKHQLDLGSVLMVGDSWVDLLAARNSGIRSVLVGGVGFDWEGGADYACRDFEEVVRLVVGLSVEEEV